MALPAAFSVANAIEEAFERVGIDPAAIETRLLASARRSIRLMLDSWNTDGVLFWKVLNNNTHTVSVGEGSFVLQDGSIDVLEARVRRNSIDTPMLAISIQDFYALPDRLLSRGMPDRYWVQRNQTGVGAPTLQFYPKAENATDIIAYNSLLYFNDASALSGAVEVPSRWNQAFVSGLAYHLAEKHAPSRLTEKKAIYGGPGESRGAYATARMGDRERGDTVFTMGRHRGRR